MIMDFETWWAAINKDGLLDFKGSQRDKDLAKSAWLHGIQQALDVLDLQQKQGHASPYLLWVRTKEILSQLM